MFLISFPPQQAEADADQAEGERDRPGHPRLKPGIRGGGRPVRRRKDRVSFQRSNFSYAPRIPKNFPEKDSCRNTLT